DPRTWADPEVAGGGYGHAQLSHSTGLLCWLTGLRPESVYALMSAPDSRVDLYDALSVRFAGGALGTVSGAGTLPAPGKGQVQRCSALVRRGRDAAPGRGGGPAGPAPPRRPLRQGLPPRRRGRLQLRGAARQLHRPDPGPDQREPGARRGGPALGRAARRG